ncbi:MAG: hypothetical protein JW731_06960 [Bacteroidales bacterium]|nr:hypothetical protein [Bacteroidales bacterium]
MKKLLPFYLICFLIIAGCASKRFTKKADKFEEAGLYQDAAEYYYEAAKRKDSNVDAKLGLRKNGQLVLENKLFEFNKAYQQADYKTSVYNFLDAEKYYNKIKSVGVNLDFPEIDRSHYIEAKEEYLQVRYAEGLDNLNREDFDAARKIFEEITEIDRNYKDAAENYKTAKYEPMYRDGISQLDNGLYRKAYYTFNGIIQGTGQYKQSSTLMDEAREKGTITILITDFSGSNYNEREYAKDITSNIKSQINSLDNPFIRVMDASGAPGSPSGNFFNGTEIDMQAANLAGIDALLIGNVDNVTLISGKLNKTIQPGYIREVTKIKNEAGEEVEKINYHKTEYEEYSIRNQSGLEMNFKLVSTETSEILVSDAYTLSNADDAHYAKFKGDKNNLVPGYWKYKDRKSSEDVVKDEKGEIRKLKNLIGASQSIKSSVVLLNELINEATNRIKNKVDLYNPEE